MEKIITKEWIVAEIVKQFPWTQSVFVEWELACFDCEIGSTETLEEGCKRHHFSDDDIDLFVSDLNESIEAGAFDRPAQLTISSDAAGALKEILSSEKEEGSALLVIANGDGSFCMEFRTERNGEEEFVSKKHPDVRVWASKETLSRVGGATIAFRNGRFKLEM